MSGESTLCLSSPFSLPFNRRRSSSYPFNLISLTNMVSFSSYLLPLTLSLGLQALAAPVAYVALGSPVIDGTSPSLAGPFTQFLKPTPLANAAAIQHTRKYPHVFLPCLSRWFMVGPTHLTSLLYSIVGTYEGQGFSHAQCWRREQYVIHPRISSHSNGIVPSVLLEPNFSTAIFW